MRVLHIIIGLNVGGAELMLKRLIQSFQDNPTYHHSVVSLTTTGKVGEELQSLGVEVQALGMRSPLGIPRILWKLVRLIRLSRPCIVQTWMYHADLIGGLAARMSGGARVIWGVRCSDIPQGRMSASGLVVFFCSLLSSWLPSRIVCCAESARSTHAKKGYDQRKMVVIPNGYELSYFNSSPEFRQEARDGFGFTKEDVVIGIVGRFDPLKDYRNFISAATVVASHVGRVQFLMVGRGIDSVNDVLRCWLAESNVANKFTLAGERSDMSFCLAAMDIFCLSSSKEGFPNVVCEAMAMNIPCVVTDAGDASEIVGDTGLVVSPVDHCALAKALESMIGLGANERKRLGNSARQRIVENYSIEIASARFEKLYELEAQGGL